MKIIAIPLFLSLIYQSNGLEGTRLLGGNQAVSDLQERQTFANKALEQLEKASNNINARKIVEVILNIMRTYHYNNFFTNNIATLLRGNYAK